MSAFFQATPRQSHLKQDGLDKALIREASQRERARQVEYTVHIRVLRSTLVVILCQT